MVGAEAKIVDANVEPFEVTVITDDTSGSSVGIEVKTEVRRDVPDEMIVVNV